MSGTPTTSNFAPATSECPRCGNTCKRHSKRRRQVKDIDLDQTKIHIITVGAYKCQSCERFFCVQPNLVQKGKHYSKRAIKKARDAVAEDKTTFSGLKRRLERDFNICPSKSTGYVWFHEAADQIDFARDYEPWAAEGFSGYLALDELYDHFVILVATDPVNDKTISVRLCRNATAYELECFLLHLKEIGINPKVIITDGSDLYQNVPQEVWPKVKHQLCLFHFTRLVTKRVLEAVGGLSRHFKKNAETKEWATRLWKSRYLFVKRPENLTLNQQKVLDDLCAKHGTIRLIRQFMERAFNLFESCQSREEAIEKWRRLVNNPIYCLNSSLRKAVRSLRPEQFYRAITFLEYPGCPRTTNHVERANRFYRKRAKTHYRNRTERAIWNMIKSDLMVRKAKFIENESG